MLFSKNGRRLLFILKHILVLQSIITNHYLSKVILIHSSYTAQNYIATTFLTATNSMRKHLQSVRVVLLGE